MNEINLIRGDTETIKVNFFKGNEEFTPNDVVDGDILTFTIRDIVTENPILVKSRTLPDRTFKLSHEETKSLEAKKYNYDIEYRKPDKRVVKTLVIGDVNVRKDVTYDDRN